MADKYFWLHTNSGLVLFNCICVLKIILLLDTFLDERGGSHKIDSFVIVVIIILGSSRMESI